MKKDGKAEVQHYVPKLLLRNFSFGNSDSPQVHVFDKKEMRQFPASIDRICGERRYNDLHVKDGIVSHEPLMTGIENLAAPLITRICIGESVSTLFEIERLSISLFVGSLFMRPRLMREEVKAAAGHIERLAKEILAQKIGSNATLQSAVDAASIDNLDDFAKEVTLELHAENAKDFAEIISQKEWIILRPTPGRSFVISDNPIAMTNHRNYSPYGNLGLTVPGVQMTLPLSPERALLMMCPTLLPEYQAMRDESAHLLEQEKALRVLGVNQDIAALDASIASRVMHHGIIDEFFSTVNGSRELVMAPEGVDEFNLNQVKQSYRFIIGNQSELDIAERLVQATPSLRDGLRMRMG